MSHFVTQLIANADCDRGRDETMVFCCSGDCPFDQTCVNQLDNNQPGCNDGLAKCAEIGRELASKYKAEVIDLHGPMTAFNLQRQKSDPPYTVIGQDRVHRGFRET